MRYAIIMKGNDIQSMKDAEISLLYNVHGWEENLSMISKYVLMESALLIRHTRYV
jgi:hypothetical protein